MSDAAKRIVDRWKRRSNKLLASVTQILGEIVSLAGNRELRYFGLSADNWNLDNPDVRQWIEQHGASMVRKASDTVREELRTFLSTELEKVQDPRGIAESVRQHFVEFPNWKADRIARTEVRDAYNAAALLSYRSAGVDKVQAFDGGGGLSGQTDPECLKRNGKVMTLEEALSEEEHPNGTLGFRPIMAVNFSVEVVPHTDLPEGAISFYEAGTETLYLAEGLDPDEMREQMLYIGDRLSRRTSE